MDFYALPGITCDVAFELKRDSNAVVDHYAEIVKERILKDGYLIPIAAFRSETKENVVHCGPMMADDAKKEQLGAALRSIAVDLEAIGFAFAAEAWTAQYDRDKADIKPSERSDRVECAIVSAQYKGDKPVMRIFEIIRDRDNKITHLLEKERIDGMSFEGRFAGILNDESEDERWTRMTRGL